MKKMMRRILGSALALAMTAGLLSGCGSAYDPVKDVMGYKGSTVMFTVNGRDVTAEEYLFWLAQQADSANMYLSAMDSEDNQGSVWDMEVQEGVTAGDSIKEAAQQYAILYSVVAGKAQAEGYSYGREDKAAYQEELATAIGASRVTVSRCLQKLAAHGWIETQYHRIRILNRAALEQARSY